MGKHRILRRAAVAAGAVMALAFAAATPAPAARAVPRAKLAQKARNADKVNGIRASRRARPGRLLPLGRDGRFPASVLANVVDSSLVQRPLTGFCPAGQAIRALTRDGVVTCQTSGGDVTSVTAGNGLSGGGTSGAIQLSVAPPLVFNLGDTDPLIDLTNVGTGSAIQAESSSGFATGYFHGVGTGTGSALRADTSSGSQGNAVTAYNYGTDGFALRAELVNALNPGSAIYARTAGGGQAIDAEVTDSTSTADAVYARSQSSDPNSWAGFFSGNVNVSGDLSVGGTLTKSAGSFRIDDPADPANKYLQHSFVESPDMKNIYDGVVRTNGRGYATVRLPHWFQALNKDFRYQLTTIRSFARAIVWHELGHGNTFVIRTEKPRVKVSWQVTGIRDDAYARAHRIAVEVRKPRSERGRFLAPRELGKPARLGIGGR